MSIFKLFAPLLAAMLVLVPAQSRADQKLELQQVTKGVYAIVGELGNRTKDNLGNNATFGLVVTEDGAVLIDSGGTQPGAREIDRLIKTVTAKSVVWVINTGGQDHRWLGNGYFKNQGAQIIASEAAMKDQKARTQDQLIVLGNRFMLIKPLPTISNLNWVALFSSCTIQARHTPPAIVMSGFLKSRLCSPGISFTSSGCWASDHNPTAKSGSRFFKPWQRISHDTWCQGTVRQPIYPRLKGILMIT
jgi:hypothetical protein